MIIPHGISELTEEVRPNLPWAENHFYERVGRIPVNPPPSHEEWPFAQKKNEQFGGREIFSHSYPERIWSKYAPLNPQSQRPNKKIKKGIRFEYGDLSDVVDLLEKEPYTRQAFLPIWFPEDTGVVHGQRVPCTIGYHFMRRENFFHMSYFIRSCDIIRHFRDDIYLAIRKMYWILDQLKRRNPDNWKHVSPGYYSMHIISLHCFNSEKNILRQKNI
jgi:hypothetical protein